MTPLVSYRHFLFFLIAAFAVFTPFSALAVDATAQISGGIVNLFGLAGMGSCSSTSFDTPCNDDPSTGLFSSIACRVMKTFNAGVVPLYCNIIQNSDYQAAVNAAFVLYATLLGFSYITGMVPMKVSVAMSRIIKASIVYFLVSQADVYFGFVYTVVLKIPQDVVQVLLESSSDPGTASSTDFFQYVDQGIFRVFNEVVYPEMTSTGGETYRKADLKIVMMGLTLWQLGGDLLGGLFFSVVVGWLASYFGIMIRYLLAMLSMMFLLMLGPIFIPTILFDRTKYLCEDWIKMLISFIIQIVMIVAFIIMIQPFYIEFFNTLKEGLNDTILSKSEKKYVVPFGEDSYKVTNRTTYTPQSAENFMSEMRDSLNDINSDPNSKGTDKQKLMDTMFRLITTFAIVVLSFMFLRIVPGLSTMLGGNARFPVIFGGQGYGNTTDSRVKLFGQARGDMGTESIQDKLLSK